MSDGSADVSRRAFLRAGAGATAVATATGSAAAQEGGGGGGNVQPVWSSYVSDANDNGYVDARGQDEVTIGVYSNYFEPTFVWVDPDTTIVWEFEEAGHNVKFNSQPDGAGLSGTPGGTFDIISPGETHTVTASTAGMYDYYCGPHESQGMKGAIAVGGEVETEEVGGGGGGGGPSVPDAAKSLGVAAAFAMAATLGLAYFFIKYGGDYGDVEGA